MNGRTAFNRFPLLVTAHVLVRTERPWYVKLGGGIEKHLTGGDLEAGLGLHDGPSRPVGEIGVYRLFGPRGYGALEAAVRYSRVRYGMRDIDGSSLGLLLSLHYNYSDAPSAVADDQRVRHRVAARDLAREAGDRGGELGGRAAVQHERVAESETGQRPPQVGGLHPGVGDDDRQEPAAVVDRDGGAARRLRLEPGDAPVDEDPRAHLDGARDGGRGSGRRVKSREWTIAARPGRSTSTPQSTTLRRPITFGRPRCAGRAAAPRCRRSRR